MMKKLIYIAVLLTSVLISCSHDDIWDELEDHKGRIENLEEICERLNTNIEALQTALSALEENDFITSIMPVKAQDIVLGYTIQFSKSGYITIYHGLNGTDGVDGTDGADGTDGTDGQSSVIGVKTDEDGVYYWTLNGEWLLDEEGNRIKASSTDGVDGQHGITPRLKIENGLWYVSYDGAKTWVLAGRATGQDGASGTNLFTDIAVEDDHVDLTLADGETVISLPRIPEIFDITFAEGTALKYGAGEMVTLNYTLSYAAEDADIRMFSEQDIDYTVWKTTASSGILSFLAPDPFMEDVELVLLVSDGGEKTLMRTVTVSLEYDESYIIRYETKNGTALELDLPAILSNSVAEGKGEIIFGTKVKTVTGFEGQARLTDITIPETASAIGADAFKDCTGLTQIVIPDGITEIGVRAFAGTFLDEVILPRELKSIGAYAFSGLFFTSVTIPDTVGELGEFAFASCPHLESVSLGSSVEIVPLGLFDYCSSLVSVTCKATEPPVLYAEIPDQVSIYVPEESVQQYKSAPGWIGHESRIFPIE